MTNQGRSYEARPEEVDAVSRLQAPDRYRYFLNKVADWEELWGIANDDGWCLYADDSGTELLPVWPARAYAHTFCADDFADHAPKAISMDEWLENWLPGLASEGTQVAVFPLLSGQGIVIDPERLADDLKGALKQYE